MNKIKILTIATVALTFNSYAATSTTSQSVTQGSSVAPEAKKLPINMSFLTMMFGPQVSDPVSSMTSSDSIGGKSGLGTRNFLSMTYKLSEKLSLTPVLDFNYQLTDNDRGASLNDAYIRLKRKEILSSNIGIHPVSMDADIRYYAPTSQGARDNNAIGAVRTSLYPSVQIAKSRFSLSGLFFAKAWMQTQDTNAKGKNLNMVQLYSGPQISYAVSDKISAFILQEANVVYNTAGIPNSRDPNTSLVDLEPGVDIQVNDRVTLSPYLNWYTNQNISTTSVNLNADIKLF